MAPANPVNSRQRSSTPGAQAKTNSSAQNKNLNQETQRGIDIKSPLSSASARASAALGSSSSTPSRWTSSAWRRSASEEFPLDVKKSLLPKFRFRTVVVMAFLVSIAAFLVLKKPTATSLSTGLDDLVYLGNVTKDWLNDFAETLPNRTSQVTARLSELTSQASYEEFSSFAAETLSKVSSFAEEAFLKASIFATDALEKLAWMKVSEGLWKIIGLTSAFMVSVAAMWWGLKRLCSRRKAE